MKENLTVSIQRGEHPRPLPAFYYSCQGKEPTILLFWLLRSSHRSTEQLKSLNNTLCVVKQRAGSRWKGFFWGRAVSLMPVPVNGCTNWHIQKYFPSLTLHDILIRLWWQAFLFMKGDATACLCYTRALVSLWHVISEKFLEANNYYSKSFLRMKPVSKSWAPESGLLFLFAVPWIIYILGIVDLTRKGSQLNAYWSTRPKCH